MKAKLLVLLMSLIVTFSMTSCSSTDSEENSESTVKVVNNYTSTPDEIELAQIINDYRVSIGLNSLETINHISFKSQEHNFYMIEKNVVNHDYFQQRSNNIIQVLGAVKVGENIAYNFSTPNSALHAWLNSQGHKANIEGDYTHFGISISINPETGKKYYTNIFMKK